MSTQNWLHIGLLLHIIGLTTGAGIILVSYITSRQFWRQYTQDKQKGIAIMQATAKLPVLAGAGILLLILSGAMMLSASHGVYGQQLWFRIKIVILIIAGNIFVNRKLGNRLREWVLEDLVHGDRSEQIGNLAVRIGSLQLFILTLFLVIFILSVFRFI